MDFINTIVELLKDPRTAISAWIAAGPLTAYGFIFLIIFIETGVVFMPPFCLAIRCCLQAAALPPMAASISSPYSQ